MVRLLRSTLISVGNAVIAEVQKQIHVRRKPCSRMHCCEAKRSTGPSSNTEGNNAFDLSADYVPRQRVTSFATRTASFLWFDPANSRRA
jgi:hypothetical protein